MKFFIENIWPHIWSIGLIVCGIHFIKKKEIGVGFEGRSPSFYIRGPLVTIIGCLVVLAGVLLLFNPDVLSLLSFGY